MFREQQLLRATNEGIWKLSLEEAYAVQARFLRARLAGGERIVGWKIGCTSPNIQRQFALTQPISGRLTEPYVHVNGARLRAEGYVDCGVEAEMVLRIGSDLDPGMNDGEICDAITAVYPGIEVHNYRFWYGNPSSQELISSNGIHAGVVVGAEHAPNLDLNAEHMQLVINGEVRSEGVGSEIMGGPLVSLRWLVQHAAEHGERVRSGDLVIPGSAVNLVRVARGDCIEARFSTLGSCTAELI
jgi:2-keto-4-pentenoate hydratase